MKSLNFPWILFAMFSISLASQPKSVQGAPSSYSGYESNNDGSSGESYSQPEYKFRYGVYDSKYNNDFGHEEERNGHTTTGQYRTLLPDGRIQVVNYWADKNGYRADVTYQTSSSSGYTAPETSSDYGANTGYSNSNKNHQKSSSNHSPHQHSSRSSFSTLKTKINGITYGY